MLRRTTGRRSIRRTAFCTALIISVLAPATASAAFHETKITEVFPGTMGFPDSAFVELQMYSAGQNFVGGHNLTTYSAAGAPIHTYPIPGNVPNGETQRTILVGDEFPPDAVNEDFYDPALGTNIVVSGGAVCFDAIDCVTWGNYFGPELASPAGPPVSPAGIPNGSSLVRTIAPNCPTLLEAADDTNNSSTDFSANADPNPRNNATTPTEVDCEPDTVITKGPKKKIKKKRATFRFSSPDAAGATFECALDQQAFTACTSPLKLKRIKPGRHVFSVRAVFDGDSDSTPATYKFKRKKKPKK